MNLLYSSHSRIGAANSSVKMANNEGESGHPRLGTLCKVKRLEISLLGEIVAIGDVYRT